MRNVDLSFIARVRLTGILAAAEGNLGKLSALQAIFEQVRFTEEEQAAVTNVNLPLTNSGWQTVSGDSSPLPKAVDEVKRCAIEDSQADVLFQELNAIQGLRLADVSWVKKLQAQLRGMPSGT